MNVIPLPKKYTENEGVYRIDGKIRSDFDLPLIADYTEKSDGASFEIIKDEDVANEGYKLTVTPERLTVKASSKSGAYYALQTVRRLCNFDLGGREVPCCEIEDEPRFKWRGLHLDESRHFFGETEVKRLLDFMFTEKLNIFHWHLTDDQGWRIEIEKYPLLTEIGSKREYTQVGGWGSGDIEYIPHGGYYTQEQIKNIIAYAAERGITVVPEIDFPAHCAAAIAAYPGLACFEKKTEVPGYFGGLIPEKQGNLRWNRTLCCGKESTFDFVFGVLDEICDLFPSEYVHIGGDEAPHGEWKRCEKCQSVMRKNALKNEKALQGWFESRLISFLKEKGKTAIGWNDIIECPGLDDDGKSLVIQYWTPKRDKHAERYAEGGGAMILSNHQSFYFDMTYAMMPLDATYNYNPRAFGIDADGDNVLGVEGELWSEWIPGREKLDLNAFPRMQALAEVAWSQENKRDFSDFKRRLDLLKPTLEKLGIGYAVDRVSLNKNIILSSKVQSEFRKGNPLFETELNKEYKAEGEK
ncbi:MAG: beta-N-acetylhexosaminidase [Eubacterium sp.]|nr:beta-N-acetylhexosaminidase [Eubacterium sp.]